MGHQFPRYIFSYSSLPEFSAVCAMKQSKIIHSIDRSSRLRYVTLDASYIGRQTSLSQDIQDIVKKPWFIGTLGGILWVILLLFSGV